MPTVQQSTVRSWFVRDKFESQVASTRHDVCAVAAHRPEQMKQPSITRSGACVTAGALRQPTVLGWYTREELPEPAAAYASDAIPSASSGFMLPPINTATPDNCAICLGDLARPVELSCSHSFCWACLANASSVGSTYKCPLCRTEHILDPTILRERRDKFRADYRDWRKGSSRGAVGEVSDVSVPPVALPSRGGFVGTKRSGDVLLGSHNVQVDVMKVGREPTQQLGKQQTN